MSDLPIVVGGVVAILSCVALVTWVARPREFRRVRVAAPARPRPAAPAVPRPARTRVAREPAAATAEARRPRSSARSFLVVTKAPGRR